MGGMWQFRGWSLLGRGLDIEAHSVTELMGKHFDREDQKAL